jgi:hypothetical protein
VSTTPTTKVELLRAAEDQYKAFRVALEGLDARQLIEVWLGVWSVKDMVAHISGWHRELGPALERMARGERPVPEGVSYDDVDAWNAKFAAARKATPPRQVLDELERSHRDFMRVAATVPAERFVPGKTAWKIVDLNSAHHYKEHGDQIRAWRAARESRSG